MLYQVRFKDGKEEVLADGKAIPEASVISYDFPERAPEQRDPLTTAIRKGGVAIIALPTPDGGTRKIHDVEVITA
jgi:hypothetical protein